MNKQEKELKKMTIEEALNNKNFENEYEVIKINNDVPFTFTKKDYRTIEGKPIYTDAIQNKRSGECIAIISQNTLAIFTNNDIDYPSPVGWSEEIHKEGCFNKCHTIAYSLSAKKCDKDNIFIGTEHLNKITMKDIEHEIYNNVKREDRIYLYKVTPQYKTENSSIPFAVLIEAETIDKGKKDAICRLCYNIQKGKKIDYYKNEGLEYKDKGQGDKENAKYKHYSINVKTKTFHLFYKKCKYIQKLEPKYIQETKACEEDIINKGFKLCKRCTNNNKNKNS